MSATDTTISQPLRGHHATFLPETMPESCRPRPDATGDLNASRTDAERCRRAAMLARMAARELAGVRSVTDRMDGAADLARLREIAGNLDGYAESRERAA